MKSWLRRLTRRRFLIRAGVCLTGIGVGVYSWRIEPHWLVVVRRDLPISNLPDNLVGKTLIQISDIHIGNLVDDDYIHDSIQLACSLEPDIIAITGDFMSCHGDEQIDHVCRVLEGCLKPAKLATVAVPGNHDYSISWKDDTVCDKLAARMPGLGIDFLRNQVRDVGGLQIIGVDELWSGNADLKAAFSGVDPKKASLALFHNPDGADLQTWNGYQGWILSGHTHGGQCKPPFLPPPILPVKNRRYTRGEIDLFDGRKLYINRGLGYIRRIRFNVRPEITVFTLRNAIG